MKKNNSKKIGGDYERIIAKKLSDWLQYDKIEKDLICWRAPHSGSVGTNLKKKGIKGIKGEHTSGDFQCLDLNYQYFFDLFHCDSKSLTDINILLINPHNKKSNKLLNEWIKVNSDSNNKIPLMFVKVRDNLKLPDFILIPKYVNIVESIDYLYIELKNELSCYLILQETFFNLENINNFYEKNKHYLK
jgi:hypothetical protein